MLHAYHRLHTSNVWVILLSALPNCLEIPDISSFKVEEANRALLHPRQTTIHDSTSSQSAAQSDHDEVDAIREENAIREEHDTVKGKEYEATLPRLKQIGDPTQQQGASSSANTDANHSFAEEGPMSFPQVLLGQGLRTEMQKANSSLLGVSLQ